MAGPAHSIDEEAAAAAIACWFRLEAILQAQIELSPADRAELPVGVVPDPADAAALLAALRCERELGKGNSALTMALGLPSTWRSRARRMQAWHKLAAYLPDKSPKELHLALCRHQPSAHGSGHPLTQMIFRDHGRDPPMPSAMHFAARLISTACPADSQQPALVRGQVT